MEENILVLGDSGTGKTHFAVQLFGRLFKSAKAEWKPESTPTNLEIFKSGFDRLAKGLQIEHTPSAFHKDITFKVINRDGVTVNFTYPDYAGEQLRNLVNDRRLNDNWKERIIKSTSWLLFIKINDVREAEDIITRGMPEFGAIGEARGEENQEKFVLGDQAFYVELLQMLVHIKEKSMLLPKELPQLTIMLSCWDEFKLTNLDLAEPHLALQSKMPMFFNFLKANWQASNLNIIGLSSTEAKLDEKVVNEDYLDIGPENFGYWVQSDGNEEKDLTKIISLIHNG
ncbi:hypothetical protein GCM10027037_11890 [Mucilaginibacter koreensis]